MAKDDEDKDDLPSVSKDFASKEDAQTWAEKVRITSGIEPSVFELDGKWTVFYGNLDEDDYSDLDETAGRRGESRHDAGAHESGTVIREDHPSKGVYGD